MTRPYIGVTTWRRSVDTDLGSARPVHSLGIEYAAPLEAAGAAVVLLPPTGGIDEVLDRLDGLVLSGGQDVHPGRYGELPQAGKSYDDARDEYEIALVLGAKKRGIPVLAICRGMQVTNIALGGTLVVDVPRSEHHRPVREGAEQLAARHPIHVAEGSRMCAAYGATDRTVNTIHHQCVGVLAPGLLPVAWAPDGIVEAIEADDGWPLWAVQWHPEKMTGPDEAAEELSLFAHFVAAAQERAVELATAEKGIR